MTFRIGKLLPMAAKHAFMHHVRPLLGGALEAPASTGNDLWKLALAGLTKLPQDHYDALSAALYKAVEFKTRIDSQWRDLSGDEAFAFKDLDWSYQVVLDARAFAVNFQQSWAVIGSEFPSLIPAFQSRKPKTSTPSSAPSSAETPPLHLRPTKDQGPGRGPAPRSE